MNSLCLAAAEDDAELIHDIVERGGVPATSHEPLNRMTPLHFAARAGNVLAIVALEKLGADVNAVDADLNSPLVLAVESHQKEAAHTLMQMGATLHGNVQKAAHKGIVANRIANRLRELATRNDQRKFIGYLAAGANPNHLSGGAGSLESHAQSKATARGRFDAAGGHSGGQREVHTLHTVVARAAPDVVRAILDAGADLHSPDARGLTPLYTAIETDADDAVVRLLKERGAELVSNAVKARRREALPQWLASHVNDLIEKRELIKAKRFIQCGVDMNLPAGFERRSNVVMAATVDGCAELLDWMLKNGGNPNATNRKGFTALGMAIEAGCLGATQVLRAAGALVGGMDTIKLLSTACVTGDLHGVIAILSKARKDSKAENGGGIDVNTRMPGDRTVLHQAAEGGHHSIIRALARVGADVHARDGHGLTPLATAMLRGKWLAALELLRSGACPSVRVCETERAFLRALKIARESEANLVAVYWCGGSSPALSDKFIQAADGARAHEAKCAFIVVHVSVEEISRGWMWRYIPRPGEKYPRLRAAGGTTDEARIGRGKKGVKAATAAWLRRVKPANDGGGLLTEVKSIKGTADHLPLRAAESGTAAASGSGRQSSSFLMSRKLTTGKGSGAFSFKVGLSATLAQARSLDASQLAKLHIATLKQVSEATPDEMRAQMEAAKARVAKWSRSFMIFQFYSVPGESAVTESIKALLQPADDNAVESFGAYSPAGEAGDGKKRKRPGLDSVAKKMAGARTVLGWGGIENYFAAVPKNSPYFTRILDNHSRCLDKIKRARREKRDELRNTLREIAEMERAGLGSDDEDAPAGGASGRDRRVSENEKKLEKERKEREGWTQVYGVELTRVMDTVPAATEAGAVAEQDTDNLESQRKLEETATVAIEAIEARRIAEEKVEADFVKEAKSLAGKGKSKKDPAKLAMDAPIRVVIHEGVKYGISRKRAKLGGDKYRQAHVGLFLSNAAENAALKAVEQAARRAKREQQERRQKARVDDFQRKLEEQHAKSPTTTGTNARRSIGSARDASKPAPLDRSRPAAAAAKFIPLPEDDFDDLDESPTRLAGAVSAGSDFLVSDPPHSPQAVVESFLGDDDDAWREDDADEEYNSVFMSGTKFSRPDSDRDDDGDDDVVVLVGPGPVVEGFMPHAHYEETVRRTLLESVPGSRAPLRFGDPSRRRRAASDADLSGLSPGRDGALSAGIDSPSDRMNDQTNQRTDHPSSSPTSPKSPIPSRLAQMTATGRGSGAGVASGTFTRAFLGSFFASAASTQSRAARDAEIAADFEQAADEFYVIPDGHGWAILETVEGGLHERGVLEEEFVMQFSWHAPYTDWLREYMEEIGPEGFVDRPAFKRAAARGSAHLVEYLDGTVPRAALESHLADSTWKTEAAPGGGRRAALHLAMVNCDVPAVDALMARDLIRQVIVPDSKACIPLFYAALRGTRMLTATVSRLRGVEKFTAQYISELLEMPNSLGLAPLHVVIEMGHVATVKCLLREGVRLTTDTDNSTGRKALHSLAQSDVRGGTMRRLTDALLAHPGIDDILDVKDAHGDTALSLAVNKGHTYLALRLLEKGASLTPDAGEALGLDNVLTVANVMHSLVLARNVAAIRWLIVRSDSDPKVLLSRDGKGRTPRDLVRLGDAIGHRIHSMLLAAEDAAMGLTDGYVDVGLTRPEDIVEQLQWEKYERAMARHRRRVRARQRARCRARFGCAGCSLCGCGGASEASYGSRSSPSPAPSKRGRSGRSEGAEGAVNKRRGVGDAKAPSRNKVAPSPGAVVEMVEVKRADDSHEKAGEPARVQTMRRGDSASEEDKRARRERAGSSARLRVEEQAADRSRGGSFNLPQPPPREPRLALDKLAGGSDSGSESSIPFGLAKVGKFLEEGFRLSDSSSDSEVHIDTDESEGELDAIRPEPARGRISRHNDFHVLIAVRTDNFMSLDMIKDTVEGFTRRRWLSMLRSKYGVVNLLAQCSHAVRRWRARGLWRFALKTANQRSSQLARLQASRLVNLLRDNDLAAWILELPTGADEKQATTNKTTATTEGNVRCEVLVAVNASREMLIALADQTELFMERTDGRMMRFRASEASKFKQHSETRMFDPSTSQSLVLRQLREVTQNMQKIGENLLDDCVFFLHNHDNGSGRAVVDGWIHRYLPMPLGKLRNYLWPAPSENSAREHMRDLNSVQAYLGSQIAFYFAFLTVLTSWQCVIVFPAIVFTTLQFIYGLQIRLVLYNVLFVLLWAGMYTKAWANKSRELQSLWEGAEVDEVDRSRPEFRGERRWLRPRDPAGKVTGPSELYELVEINRIKFTLQPHYPTHRRRLKLLLSCLIMLVAVTICGTLQYLVLELTLNYGDEGLGDPSNPNYDSWYNFEYKVLGGVITGVILPIFNVVYQMLARVLTRWENHRREVKHTDALVVKFFVVESFNAYFSLFYIAFVKENIYHLSVQLGSMIATKFIVDQFVEYGFPALLNRLKKGRKRWYMNRAGVSSHHAGRKGFLTEEEASFEQSTLPQVRDLYLEYAEMCIQYGYLVMFAPVFPVCFLLAAANNVQEIRGDLMKIVYLGRRPVPRAAKDIGVWYVFLKLFTFVACFTNAGIITVTVDAWRDASEPEHDDNALTWPFDRLAALEKRLLFFVIAASLTAMYVMYEYFVPSVPAWVQFKILRMQHEIMVPEDLRQERHSLESRIHTRKVFMMPLEDMKRWASGRSLLVTPDAIRKWRLFRPHKFRLVRDYLVKQKKAEAPEKAKGGRAPLGLRGGSALTNMSLMGGRLFQRRTGKASNGGA